MNNSLFNNSFFKSKDSLLKKSLQSQLVACVKDIQLDHAHSGKFQSSNEAAEELCTILEAIFIHGIKESLVDKIVLAMGDPDIRPEPNFWPALLVFSHRELIDQIAGLNFISTDIGRCRAWLRIVLNETLLTSYLQSMLAQRNSLSSFYKRAAYLRDKELLDTTITLISGVEAYSFNLVCNSSLLNMWPNQPLLMAGIWSPAMKSCPSISRGTDIAQSLANEDSRITEDSVSSVVSVASFIDSSLGSNAFDEEEALRIILGGQTAQSQEEGFMDTNKVESGYDTSNNEEVQGTNEMEQKRVDPSNGIENPSKLDELVDSRKEKGESCNRKNRSKEHNLKCDDSIKPTERKLEDKKPKLESYPSLVESYQTSATTCKVPDLQDLLQKFQSPSDSAPTTFAKTSPPPNNALIVDQNDKIDFEVVPDELEPTDIPDFQRFIQHINQIALEWGLDSQNYTCRRCTQHIGINFGPAKVCGLTGAYFCSDCFGDNPADEYSMIPARIIYNWDFRLYSVSQRAAKFLKQIELYPLFDLSIINPKIYGALEEMARLKELRVRLSFLSAYLLTCRENAIESLQKQIWPREYFYEKIHHYSFWDLKQVSTGQLEGILQRCVETSRSHVTSCSHCMQRGFICEICNHPKIIYPFDLDTTYRCKNCSAVYHTECLQAGQLCPKCLRIQQRLTSEDQLYLDPDPDPL